MEGLILPFLLLLGGAGIALGVREGVRYRAKQRRRQTEEWRRLAAACGLAPDEGFPMLARKGRMSVHISLQGDVNLATVAYLTGLGLPSTFRLRREGVATRLLGTRDVEVGDPAFDEAFCVLGPEPVARAILDAETRRLCLELPWDLKFTRDGLSVRIPRPAPSVARADLDTSIPIDAAELCRMVAFGERFLFPDDVGARLCANLRHDLLPEVRLHVARTLVREYPEHPLTRETLRTALSDAAPEVRLRAALALGDEGRTTLLDLAADPAVPDPCSAEAVETLGGQLPTDRAEAVLHASMAAGRRETARACLGALGASRSHRAVAPLARVLAADSGALAVAAARALGATGLPAAEKPLLDALSRYADQIRVAAAEALGMVASAAAVLPLREAVAAHGGALLGPAVRQAIARIQERTTGSPGQLSLSGHEAGQLALAEGQDGRLSLPPEGASSPPGGDGVS